MGLCTSAILPQASEPLPNTSLAKVLIVGDKTLVDLRLQRRLINLGYAIAGVATSGEQAIKLVYATFPDVILMDILIKGKLDSIETAARIPKYMRIPVIFLTGYCEDPVLARAEKTLPCKFLVRPFLDRELHTTIQTALTQTPVIESVCENEIWLLGAVFSGAI